MGERQKSRDAVERVAQRIKEHNDLKAGGMASASEARREAAEVARRADAEKDAGATKNPRKRKKSLAVDYPTRGKPTGRIFVDYGKKG